MADELWNRKSLRNIGVALANRFSDEELRNLASDLGIDYDDLVGDIQDTKARSLVKFLYRRNRMEELLEEGKESRPDIDWDGLIVPSAPEDTTIDPFEPGSFDFADEQIEVNPINAPNPVEVSDPPPNVLLGNSLEVEPVLTSPDESAPPIWQQTSVQVAVGMLFLAIVGAFAIFGIGGNRSVDVGPEALVLGKTAKGSLIEANRYGGGEDVIVFIGGLHSGKSPATVQISKRLDQYLANNLENMPSNLTVYIIEDLNPDSPDTLGQNTGRLNSNGVDPNRNAGCNWESGQISGSAPFSEEETAIFQAFVEDKNVVAAIIWAARETNGAVYPAFCGGVKHTPSQSLAQFYAGETGYAGKRFEELNQGSGELADWLASEGVAAITVLFRDHSDPDWSRNKLAIDKMVEEFGER